MNHIKEATRTVPDQRGLPSYLLIHEIRRTHLYTHTRARTHTHTYYTTRDREATRYVLCTITLTHTILRLRHNISSYYTHTHILLSIVTLYFSFTVITEIKHYQLKPHNYTLAEVYTYLVNF